MEYNPFLNVKKEYYSDECWMIAIYCSFNQSGLQGNVQSCKYKWAVLFVILLFSLRTVIGGVCYSTFIMLSLLKILILFSSMDFNNFMMMVTMAWKYNLIYSRWRRNSVYSGLWIIFGNFTLFPLSHLFFWLYRRQLYRGCAWSWCFDSFCFFFPPLRYLDTWKCSS